MNEDNKDNKENSLEYISKKVEQDIIISSKLERHQVLTAIENMFPNIKEHIFISKFEELLNSSKQFEYIENFESKKYSGNQLLKSLVLNCSQQFCFWLNTNLQDTRVLSSSNFNDVSWDTYNTIINKSVTLRKERLQIAKELWNIEEEYGLDYLTKVLNSETFNIDFFKKKKNLLIMCLDRFKKDLNFESSKYFVDSINPAIDYQIPKMLRAFDIIEYPTPIESKINYGKIILKDSTEELFIRSVSYMALCMIQDKYKFNQAKLDWWLWSNRHNELVRGKKHHCTITEDY